MDVTRFPYGDSLLAQLVREDLILNLKDTSSGHVWLASSLLEPRRLDSVGLRIASLCTVFGASPEKGQIVGGGGVGRWKSRLGRAESRHGKGGMFLRARCFPRKYTKIVVGAWRAWRL
jgi:hypothetical protein